MSRQKQTDFDEDTSCIGSDFTDDSKRSIYPYQRVKRGTSFWQARSKLEKILILTLGCFSIILLIFIGALISLLANNRSTRISHAEQLLPDRIPCLETSCIHTSSEIIRSIDTSIDPCDDFYAFSCNQWIKNNPIPDGKTMWGIFGQMERRNQLVVKNILERPLDSFKSKAEKKAKLYYQSCMDEDGTMEELGAEPLQKLLVQIGGWNASSSGFNVSTWSLSKSLKILQNKYNMGGLFVWAVGEDDRNASYHIIQIDQGGLTLPMRENYLNTRQYANVLSEYLGYMTRIVVLLGGNEADARSQMSAVIDFETKLAEITTPPEGRTDDELLYYTMTLAELQDIAPFIDWRDHFEDAFRLVKRNVFEKEVVLVYAKEYLTKLTRVITEYSATTEGKIILNNYLVWQTVRSFTGYLSKDFRNAFKGLRKALIGSEGGEEPWRYCVADTTKVMGFVVGAMFVRETFHGQAKTQAEQMINEIRAALQGNLRNLDWMDEETRKIAEEKVDAISNMIGFPDYILKAAELDENYKDLDIDQNKYFENNVRVNMYDLKSNLIKLDQPVNKTRWQLTPSTVNAYYSPTKNQILFPAGVLQRPLFDTSNPKSLNFGAIGALMGHELIHALDDQGREYDKFGNLHQWWNSKTIEGFNERVDCLSKQYEEYKINGKNLNGKQTLGENIADNGGLRAAFNAYIKSKNESDYDVLLLPGINMTHKQLFFVSFAQTFCSAVTDETANLQIEKDHHSPPKFRVIGPLTNFKEFSEEFQCKLGSPMNPVNKCEIW